MRKMKDSGIEWIGEIPEDWEVCKLKPFLQWKSVKGFGNETVLSLYRDFGIIPKESRDDNHNVTSLDTDSYKLVEIGDFVINKMKAWQGSMAISNYRGIVSPAYHVCSIKNSKIYKPYFHYLMRNKSYLPEYERLSSGLRIGQWDLSFEDFCQIKFIIPSFIEQQRIADFLDDKVAQIDSVISKTRETIEEYKKLKQSIITEVVTGKVKIENGKVCGKYDTYKDSGVEWIGEIPSDWDCFYLSQIFSPVKNKNIGMQETNLLSLSYGKIIRKNIETTFGLLPENFEGYNIIERDNIVLRLTDLQNDHKSLRVGLVTEKGIITSAYLTLKNKTNMSSNYFYYLLHSFDIAKGFYGMGAGVRQGLNWNEIRSLRLITPKNVLEQQKIADFLDNKCFEIDSLIAKKEQLVVELEAYKKSLIYEVVTGKKECNLIE